MWYEAVPLLFVALHEYMPKSSAVLGVSVSVLLSCVELTPSIIARPALNQVRLAGGFAYTAHFMVVTWPIHDWIRGFEEAFLLKWSVSKYNQYENLNRWRSTIISLNISNLILKLHWCSKLLPRQNTAKHCRENYEFAHRYRSIQDLFSGVNAQKGFID